MSQRRLDCDYIIKGITEEEEEILKQAKQHVILKLIHAISPEEMTSEMKAKLKIILMIFNLKIEGKKTFKAYSSLIYLGPTFSTDIVMDSTEPASLVYRFIGLHRYNS